MGGGFKPKKRYIAIFLATIRISIFVQDVDKFNDAFTYFKTNNYIFINKHEKTLSAADT